MCFCDDWFAGFPYPLARRRSTNKKMPHDVLSILHAWRTWKLNSTRFRVRTWKTPYSFWWTWPAHLFTREICSQPMLANVFYRIAKVGMACFEHGLPKWNRAARCRRKSFANFWSVFGVVSSHSNRSHNAGRRVGSSLQPCGFPEWNF